MLFVRYGCGVGSTDHIVLLSIDSLEQARRTPSIAQHNNSLLRGIMRELFSGVSVLPRYIIDPAGSRYNGGEGDTT